MAVEITFHKTHCGKPYNKASVPSEQSDYNRWSKFSYDIIYTTSPVRLTFSFEFVAYSLHVQGRPRVFKSDPAEEVFDCRRHNRGINPPLDGRLRGSPQSFFFEFFGASMCVLMGVLCI